MFAALGVVIALFARTQSGQGTTIDVSMLDSLVSWMTPFLVPPMNNLPTRTLPPQDPGYGLFATADGRQITLSIAGEDPMWKALCNLVGLQQFADLTELDRSARAQEIGPLLRAAVALWPYDDLYMKLEQLGIAFGPVRRLHQVLDDPQMVARVMAVDVQGPNGQNGMQTFIRQPLMLDGQVGHISSQAPPLGQHNAELLGPLAAQPG